MHIKALVCPFNVANCYDETMTPHAFDKFLANFEGLPMFAMHDHEIGHWEKAWKDDAGLWLEGDITDIAAIVAAKSGDLPECSIDWGKGDVVGRSYRRAEEQKEDYGVPFVSFSDYPILPAMEEHRDVELAETSLVDRGAFEGTYWEEC